MHRIYSWQIGPTIHLRDRNTYDSRFEIPTTGMQISTNEPNTPGRLERKQKQLLDVRHVLWMQDDSESDLDLVEFDVSADKSSTESENEGLPLTPLPAASRQQQRQ